MMQISSLLEPSLRRTRLAALSTDPPPVPRSEAVRACDVLFARTACAGPASDDDRRAIIGALGQTCRVENGRAIPAPARSTATLQMIVAGWAYCAHVLADGGRQVSDVLLPGDVFDQATMTVDAVEHELRACGEVQVAALRRDVVTGRDAPGLRRRWDWIRDAEVHRLRARLISLGRRTARERMAYFIVELHDRLQPVGLVHGNAFACPLTQEQLADALGLTAVHVNRVLQPLRREQLISFTRPHVTIHDLDRLKSVACLYKQRTCGDLGERK